MAVVGTGCFYGCSSLKRLTYLGTSELNSSFLDRCGDYEMTVSTGYRHDSFGGCSLDNASVIYTESDPSSGLDVGSGDDSGDLSSDSSGGGLSGGAIAGIVIAVIVVVVAVVVVSVVLVLRRQKLQRSSGGSDGPSVDKL